MGKYSILLYQWRTCHFSSELASNCAIFTRIACMIIQHSDADIKPSETINGSQQEPQRNAVDANDVDTRIDNEGSDIGGAVTLVETGDASR